VLFTHPTPPVGWIIACSLAVLHEGAGGGGGRLDGFRGGKLLDGFWVLCGEEFANARYVCVWFTCNRSC